MTSRSLGPWTGWIALALLAVLAFARCRAREVDGREEPARETRGQPLSDPTKRRVRDAWTEELDATLAKQRWIADELLDDARARRRVRVFVQFQASVRPEAELADNDRAQQRAQIAALQKGFLTFDRASTAGAPVLFATVPLASITLDRDLWTSLVQSVSASLSAAGAPPLPFRLEPVPALRHQRASPGPALADITADELCADVQADGLAVDGSGQVVVVIDDGVRDDPSLPLIAGRVIGGDWQKQGAVTCLDDPLTEDLPAASGAPGSVDPYDMNHGTQVACLVAAVAPKIELVSIRVDEGGAEIPLDNVLAALERVKCVWLARQPSIAAVCLALGDGGASGRHVDGCAGDPANRDFALLVQNLVDAGVAVVLPAGNEGVYGSVSFPGCLDPGVTVGGTVPWKLTSASTRVRADFSNWGELVELAAPALSIGLEVGWSTYPYTVSKGTSVAVPIVAGGFALARQAHGSESVARIQEAFVATAVEAHDESRLAGRPAVEDPPVPFLQVRAALDWLAGR